MTGRTDCKGRRRLLQHGLSRTPEYHAWAGIRHRCLNPSSQAYENYGGRGITICPEWRDDVVEFVKAVGQRPSPAHSLERVDNDRGYEPGNVRWATAMEQTYNRRNSRKLHYRGELRTMDSLAKEFGIKYTTLLRRVDDWGWDLERALNTTVQQTRAGRTRNEKGQYE